MGRPRGFLEIPREKALQRPVEERRKDWREVNLPVPEATLRLQAARCMDCGVPFCHQGCPLGNLIPDWNDLVQSGRWQEAASALHATNNFPEVTGRVCPAPCETSCVLNLENAPVTIKNVEHAIADRAFEAGWVKPQRATFRSGKAVVIVGSGPAGLAAAQQLARKGHEVTVLEKADRIGGLLRYGIPDFKMEKALLDRRLEQMAAEGVQFKTQVNAGVDITGAQLRERYDAVVLCGGASVPRDLPVPGRHLKGIHFAMDFLTQQNQRGVGQSVSEAMTLSAQGKSVVVLGGGDTGSDCVGTSHRQQASAVTSLELMARPPESRGERNPWPAWPLIFRTSSSHDEGGDRHFGVVTQAFLDDGAGNVRALQAVRTEGLGRDAKEIPGSQFELPAQLVLLAMGFLGPLKTGLLDQLGVQLDGRGNVQVHQGRTSIDGVFAAGDMARGQSLVVWAIAEGRKVAESVDAFLQLPSSATGS